MVIQCKQSLLTMQNSSAITLAQTLEFLAFLLWPSHKDHKGTWQTPNVNKKMFVSKSETRFEYLHLKVHQYTANYLGFSFGLSISKKWSGPISFCTWNSKEILYKRQTISRRSRYVNKIVHSIFRSVAYLNSPCCRRRQVDPNEGHR